MITIVSPEEFLDYDLHSRVIALDDPTGAGALLAVTSNKFRKFAVKWPAERAQLHTRRSYVFVPGKLFEASDFVPEEHLSSLAIRIKRGTAGRSTMSKDPADPNVTITRVTYTRGRKDKLPIDASTFTEEGLGMDEGDLIQTRESKEVRVQTKDGLTPVSYLLDHGAKRDVDPSRN